MKQLEVLLVEDNEADALLTKTALEDLASVHIVDRGEHALAFLRKEDPHSEAPSIDLILVDQSLPGVSGVELIREIKGDTEYRSIPVIIMAGSERKEDVLEGYEAGANGYIVKARSFTELRHKLTALVKFWGSVARLPSKRNKE